MKKNEQTDNYLWTAIEESKDFFDAHFGRAGEGWKLGVKSLDYYNSPNGESSAVVQAELFYRKDNGEWSEPVVGVGYSPEGNARLAFLDAFKTALNVYTNILDLRDPEIEAALINSLPGNDDEEDDVVESWADGEWEESE